MTIYRHRMSKRLLGLVDYRTSPSLQNYEGDFVIGDDVTGAVFPALLRRIR